MFFGTSSVLGSRMKRRIGFAQIGRNCILLGRFSVETEWGELHFSGNRYSLYSVLLEREKELPELSQKKG